LENFSKKIAGKVFLFGNFMVSQITNVFQFGDPKSGAKIENISIRCIKKDDYFCLKMKVFL